MRSRGTPTRLELHRMKFHQAGRRGSLLTLSSLSDEEKEIIQRELLQDVRVKKIDFTGEMDEEIFDGVYLEVLAEWGVMCTHPASSTEPVPGMRARRCKVCDCVVIGRDAMPIAASE